MAHYQPRRRRPGCLFTLLMLVIIVMAAIWFLPAPAPDTILGSWLATPLATVGQDDVPPLDEIWSTGQGSNKVIRIPLNGLIMLNQSETGIFSGPSSTALAKKAIQRATSDPAVKAIIMEIDSGGGGVTASDILYHALINFKKTDPNRRVVTIGGDLLASGAYYIALASDRIIARPTTTVGSIGVIIQSLNVRELAARYGVKDVTYKSGENKDLMNPLGTVSDQEREILQTVVDELHARFVSLVAKHRAIPDTELRPLTDGRVFSAEQAQAFGLIDDIGYWETALKQTRNLLGVDAIIVYRYEEEFSFSSLIQAVNTLHPRSWFGQQDSRRLEYRFR
jgi:protease-4